MDIESSPSFTQTSNPPELDFDFLSLTSLQPRGSGDNPIWTRISPKPLQVFTHGDATSAGDGTGGFIPAECGLLAVSNEFGWAAMGVREDGAYALHLHSLATLRSLFLSPTSPPTLPTPHCSLPIPSTSILTFVKFGAGDKVLIIGCRDKEIGEDGKERASKGGGGQVAWWRTRDLILLGGGGQKLSNPPLYVHQLSHPLQDLLPQPGDNPHLLALLLLSPHFTTSGPPRSYLQILSLLPSPLSPTTPPPTPPFNSNNPVLAQFPNELNTPPSGDWVTSAAWSVRGKQIACATTGERAGIVQIEANTGAEKARMSVGIGPLGGGPEGVQGWFVNSLTWLENDLFLLSFSLPQFDLDSSEPLDHSQFKVFGLHRNKQSQAVHWIGLYDPTSPSGLEARPRGMNDGKWMAWIKNWGAVKHLCFLASGPSVEIGAVGSLIDGAVDSANLEGTNKLPLANIALDENCRPSLPFDNSYNPTCPLGLELDLTSTEMVSVVSSDGDTTTQEELGPVLMAYNNDGMLVAWRIGNRKGDGARYPGLVGERVRDVRSQEDGPSVVLSSGTTAGKAVGQQQQQQQTQPKSAAAFGASSSTMGASAFGGGPAAFGSTSSKIPSFGSSGFGSTPSFGKPAFGQSSFGAATSQPTPSSTTGAPSFGQTAGLGSSAGGGVSGFSGFASTGGGGFGGFASSTGGGGFSGFGNASNGNKGASIFGGEGGSGSSEPEAVSKEEEMSGGDDQEPKPSVSASTTTPSTSGPAPPGNLFGGGGSAGTDKPVFGASTNFGLGNTKPSGSSGAGFSFSGISSSSTTTASPTTTTTMAPLTGGGGFGSFASSGGFGALSSSKGGSIFDEDKQKDKSVPPPLPSSTQSTTTGALSASAFAPRDPSLTSSSGGGGGGFGGASRPAGLPAKPNFKVPGLHDDEEEVEEEGVAFGQKDKAKKDETSGLPSAFGFGSMNFGGANEEPKKPVSPKKEEASIASTLSQPPPPVAKTEVEGNRNEKKEEGKETPKAAAKTLFDFSSSSASTPATKTPQKNENDESKTKPNLFGSSTFGSKPALTPSPQAPVNLFGNTTTESRPSAPANLFGSMKPSGDTAATPKSPALQGGMFGNKSPSTPPISSAFSGGPFGQKQPSSDEAAKKEGTSPPMFSFKDGLPPKDKDQEDKAIVQSKMPSPTTPDTNSQSPSQDTPKSMVAPKPVAPQTSTPSLLSRLSPVSSPKPDSDAGSKSPPTSTPASPIGFSNFKPPQSSTPALAASIPLPASPATSTPASPAMPPSAGLKPGGLFPQFKNPTAPAQRSPLASPPINASPSGDDAGKGKERKPSPLGLGGGFGQQFTGKQPSPGLGLAPSPIVPPTITTQPPTPNLGFSFNKNNAPAGQRSPSPSSPSTPQRGPSLSHFAPPQNQRQQTPEPPDRQEQVIAPPAKSLKSEVPQPGDLTAVPSGGKKAAKDLSNAFLEQYMLMEEELGFLKKYTTHCTDFVSDIRIPNHSSSSSSQSLDFTDHDNWTLGDAVIISKEIDRLGEGLDGIKEDIRGRKRKCDEISGRMLQGETKREECARFIRARKDPNYAKMLKIRNLGPEQLESQKKLRRETQAVENRLGQIEEQATVLKARLNQERSGRRTFQTPSLDQIQRSIRNINLGVARKFSELDNLEEKLDKLRLIAPPTSSKISLPHYHHHHQRDSSRRVRESTPGEIVSPTLGRNSIGVPPPSISTPKPPSLAKTSLNKQNETHLINHSVKSSLASDRLGQVLKVAIPQARGNRPMINQSLRKREEQLQEKTKLNLNGDANNDIWIGDGMSNLQEAFQRGPITAKRLVSPRMVRRLSSDRESGNGRERDTPPGTPSRIGMGMRRGNSGGIGGVMTSTPPKEANNSKGKRTKTNMNGGTWFATVNGAERSSPTKATARGGKLPTTGSGEKVAKMVRQFSPNSRNPSTGTRSGTGSSRQEKVIFDDETEGDEDEEEDIYRYGHERGHPYAYQGSPGRSRLSPSSRLVQNSRQSQRPASGRQPSFEGLVLPEPVGVAGMSPRGLKGGSGPKFGFPGVDKAVGGHHEDEEEEEEEEDDEDDEEVTDDGELIESEETLRTVAEEDEEEEDEEDEEEEEFDEDEDEDDIDGTLRSIGEEDEEDLDEEDLEASYQ